SIPTELLARIIELSTPSSLAATALVSRSWNRAVRTLIATLGLKMRLKLHFLEPERRNNIQSSQRPDASPSWLVGVQNTRFLPEFEREVLAVPFHRAVLMAMVAEVTIDCRAFTALVLVDLSEATWSLSEDIANSDFFPVSQCLEHLPLGGYAPSHEQ
ncbi:hypothetical protein M427DRAFT_505296, partial [Gonapodya prolifera JEL478]